MNIILAGIAFFGFGIGAGYALRIHEERSEKGAQDEGGNKDQR